MRKLISRPAAVASAALAVAALAVAAPASAAPSVIATKTCVANDTGYRIKVSVWGSKVPGVVDITNVSTDFEHRILGIWDLEDWAGSATIAIKNAGNTYQSFTWNPLSRNDHTTNTPNFTPNNLQVVVSASGKSGAVKVSGCVVSVA